MRENVNNINEFSKAVRRAKEEIQRPSIIKIRTHIAFGSPNKVDTAGAHGSPLGEPEVKLVKQHFGFDPEKSFAVPDDVLEFYRGCGKKGGEKERAWNELYKGYQKAYPELAKEYELLSNGGLPEGWKEKLPVFKAEEGKIATRQASGKVLNAIADTLPTLIGGSADRAPSTEPCLKKYE